MKIEIKNLMLSASIVTIGLLSAGTFWSYKETIAFYAMLVTPSLFIQTFHPGPAQSNVTWGVYKPIKVSPKKSSRPNVILIVADDLGIHDISADSGIKTPHLDSIYKNGVNFVNAYSGHATCAPSRAALFTGRFATRFGFEFTPTPKFFGKLFAHSSERNIHQGTYFGDRLDKVPPRREMVVPSNEVMIAENLSSQFDYNTYLIGKWHLGETKETLPTARGFDESLSFDMGASKYLQSYDKNVVNAIIPNSPLDDFLRWNLPFIISHNNQPKFQPGEYMTDYLSHEASKLIHTLGATKNSNPFFLTLAYNAPHNPLQALRSDYEDPELDRFTSHNERVYMAMIKALDRGVGTVLQALKDTGSWENTIVIFTSDNGGANYIDIDHVNHPYRGWKGSFFEGGIRVPLYMQWPKMIPAGLEVKESVSHVDVYPTVVAAAAMDMGADMSRENRALPLCSTSTVSTGFEKNYTVTVGSGGADATAAAAGHQPLKLYPFPVLRLLQHVHQSGAVSDEVAIMRARLAALGTSSAVSIGNLFNLHIYDTEYASGARSASSEKPNHVNKPQQDLDGVNVLPYVIPSQPQSYSQSKGLDDRTIFWRSGDYKAVIYSNWKLQVSARPNKIWFFNLLQDPVEANNLAPSIGVSTNEDLLRLVQGGGNSSYNDNEVAQMLVKVFDLLEKENAEQREPLWPSLVEVPVLIDRTANSREQEGDEYIYWAN